MTSAGSATSCSGWITPTRNTVPLEADPIPEPPSFYFRRQVFATFQEDRVGIQSRADVGVGSMMWASDFPHSDSTWPRSRDIVERDFADVPSGERDAIVWENCARVYGLG